MLRKIEDKIWLNKFGSEPWFGIFHHPDFLAIHAENAKAKQVHYIYEYKNKPAIALSSLQKGNDLIAPNQFYRTGFWINQELSDFAQTEILIAFLEKIQLEFRNLKFYFTPEIRDIRSFLWAGFSHELAHTAIKKLGTYNYHKNIDRMLKKTSNGLTLTINDAVFEEIIEKHKQDWEKFKIRNKYIESYMQLFRSLNKQEFVVDINYRDGNEIAASVVVLIDPKQKKAYMQLIGTSEKYYSQGIHAKIYDKAFKYLYDLGYEEVDLYGVDMKGFALFKMKFDTDMQIYFKVSFNHKKHRISNFLNFLKAKFKVFLINRGWI